jgi:hypothetical protein
VSAGSAAETFKRRLSNESGGEGGSRRVSFGAESVVGNQVLGQEQPLRPDVATARLSLEPQQSTTGRESFAGLSKTPMLPVAGSSTSVSNSITPAAVITATPGSNGPVVSPAATAAILAGVAPAPKRDEQMNLLLLQNMIHQWSFLCAR